MEGVFQLYQQNALTDKWRHLYIRTTEAEGRLTLMASSNKNSRLSIDLLDISAGIAKQMGHHRFNVYSKERHAKQHETQKTNFEKPYWRMSRTGQEKPDEVVSAINAAIAKFRMTSPAVTKTVEKKSSHHHTNVSNHRSFSILTLTGSCDVDTHESTAGSMPSRVGDAPGSQQDSLPIPYQVGLGKHIRSKSSIQMNFLFADSTIFKFDDAECVQHCKSLIFNGSALVVYVTRANGARIQKLPNYKDVPLDEFYQSWATGQASSSNEDLEDVFRSAETERYNVFCDIMNEVKTSVFPVIAVFRLLKSAAEKPAVFGTLLIKWMTGQPLSAPMSRQLMITQRSLYEVGIIELPCSELTLLPNDVLQPYDIMRNLVFSGKKRAITHYKSNSNSAIDYPDTVLAEEISQSHLSPGVRAGEPGPTPSVASSAHMAKTGRNLMKSVTEPAVLDPAAQGELNRMIQRLKLEPSVQTAAGTAPHPPSISPTPHADTSTAHAHVSSVPVQFFGVDTDKAINGKSFFAELDRKLNEGFAVCLDVILGTAEPKSAVSFRLRIRGEALSGQIAATARKITLNRIVEIWRAPFRVINETIQKMQELDHENVHTDKELGDVLAQHFADNVCLLMCSEEMRLNRFFNPSLFTFCNTSFVIFRLLKQPIDTLAPASFGDVIFNFGLPLSLEETSLVHWRDSCPMTAKVSTVVQAQPLVTSLFSGNRADPSILDYQTIYTKLFKTRPTTSFCLRNDWTQDNDEQNKTTGLYTMRFIEGVQSNGVTHGRDSVDLSNRLRIFTHHKENFKGHLNNVLQKGPSHRQHPHHKKKTDDSIDKKPDGVGKTPTGSDMENKGVVSEHKEAEEGEEEDDNEDDEETDGDSDEFHVSEEQANELGFKDVDEMKAVIEQVEIAYDRAKKQMTDNKQDITNRNLLELNYRKVMQNDILKNFEPLPLRTRLGQLYQSGSLRRVVELFHPQTN